MKRAIKHAHQTCLVGTVSLSDKAGKCIQTYRYGCSADVNPAGVLKEMTSDVIYLQSLRRKSGCKELPMTIVQDGAPEMWTLVESAVERALPGWYFHEAIDQYHLAERLAESPGGITQSTERLFCESGYTNAGVGKTHGSK